MIADSRPDRPLWVPDPARSAATRMAAFTAHARTVSGQALASYAELHAWSVGQPEPFWTAIWDFCGVVGERGAGPALIDPDRMPGAQWFPQARLNFAENLLRDCGNPEALVFWGEDKVTRTLSRAELRRQVAQFAAALQHAAAAELRPGERGGVALFQLNTLIPQAHGQALQLLGHRVADPGLGADFFDRDVGVPLVLGLLPGGFRFVALRGLPCRL